MFRRVIANSEADCKPSPSLEAILHEEIARTGPLPCARFMEVALYHPEHGYYECDRSVVGQRGDFYTSVSVGEPFGQLLAFQFAEWLDELGTRNAERGMADASLQIVEAGAHDGQLAEDVLLWLQRRRPELFGRVEYWILDPSARRQAWQRERLSMFGSRVKWFANWGEVQQAGGVTGVIFGNELLDAFPVHRLAWNAAEQRWFEWGVRSMGERFILSTLDHLDYYRRNFRKICATRERLSKALAELGFNVLPSQTNFILVEPPEFEAEDWLARLKRKKILVRWFRYPEVRRYLRITIGNDREVNQLLGAVRQILRANGSASKRRPRS